jgi:hypothetical protein
MSTVPNEFSGYFQLHENENDSFMKDMLNLNKEGKD